MWSGNGSYGYRTWNTFFYNREARVARIEREKRAASPNKEEESNTITDNSISNNFIEIDKSDKNSKKLRLDENDIEKQSNKILQNILQASKLFEGRFTYNELSSLDIPNFEALVDNEFANIDNSYKNFREKGIVNAYTKGETNASNSEDLKFLNNAVKTMA